MKPQNESEILWHEVFKWIESGKTRSAIAKEIGISVGQLRYRLKKHLEQQNSQVPKGAAENPGVDSFVTNSKSLFDESWTRSFGENRLVVLVKEPRTIHAYWEVNEIFKRLICEHFQLNWSNLPIFLQVYDVTDIYFNGFNAHSKRLIQVHPLADNWYIHGVLPNRNYIVDYGTKTNTGQFFTVLRSNVARMPAEQSEIMPQPDIRFGTIQTISRDKSVRDDIYTSVPVSNAHILQDGTAPYETEFDGYSVVTVQERDGH
jgi:hypothetical protein